MLRKWQGVTEVISWDPQLAHAYPMLYSSLDRIRPGLGGWAQHIFAVGLWLLKAEHSLVVCSVPTSVVPHRVRGAIENVHEDRQAQIQAKEQDPRPFELSNQIPIESHAKTR